MDGLVAARRPAGALLQAQGVIRSADEDGSARSLLLEVAFEAEVRVAHGQQLGIDGAVRRVAGRCSLRASPRARRRTARAGPGGSQEQSLILAESSEVPPPCKMDPLCGEWQSVQLILPSGTGWWLGRLKLAAHVGWHW